MGKCSLPSATVISTLSPSFLPSQAMAASCLTRGMGCVCLKLHTVRISDIAYVRSCSDEALDEDFNRRYDGGYRSCCCHLMMVRTRPSIPPAACSESVDSRSLLSHPTDDPPLAPRFRPMPRLWTRKSSISARRNDECAHIGTQMARFAFLSAHGCRFDAHLGTL